MPIGVEEFPECHDLNLVNSMSVRQAMKARDLSGYQFKAAAAHSKDIKRLREPCASVGFCQLGDLLF
jgi:hypothetical protein